jgi:uncharacterized lipoprotein YajG
MNKKSLLMIGAVASIFMLASCKKDHTCTCTYTDNSTSPSTKVTVPITFAKSKTKDAQAACDASATTYKMAYPDAACTLK